MNAQSIRKTAILLTLSLIVLVGFTQSPQGFTYQAVVRNATGSPIGNKTIGLKITLQDALGFVYYSETHAPLSNDQGVISVVVGKGTKLGVNTFSEIPWGKGEILIKADIDPNGGSDYTLLGVATNLQSVPYALYANPKEILSDPDAANDSPIFEVKNKDGKVVFGVYQGGVRVYVEDTPIKGAKGGFAVGGLSQTKAGESTEYFRITPDSARIYIDDSTTPKGAKGGFAVGGRSQTKASGTSEYLRITADSTRIYIDDLPTKGAKGGFAVGGRSQTKGLKSFFNVSAATTADVVKNESRIMWYPTKSALLAGDINIVDPINVGLNSMSLGYQNIAKGNYSQAMGFKSQALGNYSTAIGYEAEAGESSFSFGRGSKALGIGSFAFGGKGVDDVGTIQDVATEATGNFSFAFGLGSKAKALGSFVLGVNCESNAKFAIATGFGSKATGANATAMGLNTEASGIASFASGNNSKALALNSTSIGVNNVSSGIGSFTLGSGNNATNTNSFAFGALNTASGINSFAFGVSNTATGLASIVGGDHNTAAGANSFAIGTYNQANGDGSAALGSFNVSGGVNATSFGDSNTAGGSNSLAVGSSTHTTSNNSVAMGNTTTASAENSLALGFETTTTGKNSVAAGEGTTAQAYSSIVIGKYNTLAGNSGLWVNTDPLLVAGNGVDNTTRSDAMVLYKNGNLSISGALNLPVTTVSANTTLNATNYTVLVNSSGSIIITLPLANSSKGRIYVIKKVITTGGTVTILRQGTDTIDGVASQAISTLWAKIIVQSDGANWYIIN